MSDVVVGIDLGTTYSAIAYVDEDGIPQIIEVDDRTTLPSAVLFQEDGSVVVGQQALNQASIKPLRVVQWIKRSVGEEDYKRFIPKEDLPDGELPTDKDGQVIAEGTWYSPEEISAEILKKLVAAAEAELGRPVKKAVITCPAWFDDRQRKATQKAGELAGLEVLKVVNEPTAAAVYYGLSKLEDGDILLAYDLGGGTFDCSVMQYKLDSDGNPKLLSLASDGDSQLGGHDWTEHLLDEVGSRLTEHFGENPLLDPETRDRLYEHCERAKRDSSTSDSQTIPCTYQGSAADVEITWDEFAELTEPLIATTMDFTQKALDKAGKSWSDVTKVLLVGGSTRLRSVKEALREASGKEPITTGAEDTMVALGAAILSAEHVRVRRKTAGGKRETKIVAVQDVVQETATHSLGVLAAGGAGKPPMVNRVIIPAGSPIPAERSDNSFKTRRDDYFDVPVLQGEDENPDLCSLNLTYRFTCLPDMPVGSPVEVTFAYNGSNQISVSAKDTNSGRSMQCEPIKFQMPQTRQGGAVDLCFVVDATGSMAGCIEGVKRGITDFCNDLTRSQFRYRLALVEYRDERIGEPTNSYEWTDDVEKFRQWVGGLQAAGGGDEPESALDGLAAAAAMQSGQDTSRIAVLVTDASTHPTDKQNRNAGEIGKLLSQQQIKLFAISPIKAEYESLVKATGGQISNFHDNFSVGRVDPEVFKGVLKDVGQQVIDTLLESS